MARVYGALMTNYALVDDWAIWIGFLTINHVWDDVIEFNIAD